MELALGVAHLMRGERDVLRAFAAGLMPAEVAVRLGLTPDMVRAHLAATMRKLEARSDSWPWCSPSASG